MSAPLAGSDFDKNNQMPPGGLPPPPKYGTIPDNNGTNYGYQAYPNSGYGATAPAATATYIPEPEPGNTGIQSNGFESNDVRRVFIRKVYFMLAIMLSITAGVICICLLVEPINSYIRNGGGLWIMWTGWGVFIFLYFFLVCPCCSVRRKYPLNLVMLGLISIAMGWSLGATCCYYEFDEIVQAGLGTVGIVVGITLLTYLNFFDITKIWQIIMLIPLAMLFTWPWFWIFGYNNALYTFYCSLGVAAAALFLAFDTKMIMGGGRIELSPDEWVVAVVELYYDICLIFQYMLALMGRD